MAQLIFFICALAAYGVCNVSAQTEVELRVFVLCRRQLSKQFWKLMAEKIKMIASFAVGVPQQTLSALSDSLKGTSIIYDAVDAAEANGLILPKEALEQLNHWSITYPVHVSNILGNLASRYPDFVRAFGKLLADVQSDADKLTIMILQCQPNPPPEPPPKF